MELTIYNKSNTEISKLKEFNFIDSFMGATKITATLYSPDKLDIGVDSYVSYHNVKYSIFKKPTGLKSARTGENIGDSMKYDLEFFSPKKILETINFEDYVSKDDTDQYYTGTSTFYFYNNVAELALRLQANLDRFESTSGQWSVIVDDSVILEEKQVSISNLKLSEGLDLVSSLFELNYMIVGSKITIGRSGAEIENTFFYGKNKGLYDISRTYENGYDVITRLKVYGGSRNLPNAYLRDENGKGRYFTELMLPDFATTGIDYVDAPDSMIEEYGIREGVIVFEDIFPSIEEVIYDDNRIDEIVSVDTIDEDSDYFTVTLNDLGFNINDYLTSNTAVLSIKGSNSDGSPTYLGGYEFEIALVDGNKVTLLKNNADNNTLPDLITTVRAGDRFVILYITMPDIYITNAENKLLARANEYFTEDGSIELSYIINPDPIFIENNNIDDRIIAGNQIKIQDEDLDVANYFPIQSVDVKHGTDLLPKYSIKLSNLNSNTIKKEFNKTKVEQNNVNTFMGNTVNNNNTNNNIKITNIGEDLLWE